MNESYIKEDQMPPLTLAEKVERVVLVIAVIFILADVFLLRP